MVLGLKPMGKPSTKKNFISFKQDLSPVWLLGPQTWGKLTLKAISISFGQNQGLAWSSDSSLWGNQVQDKKSRKY